MPATLINELLSLGAIPDGINTLAAIVGDSVSLALPTTVSTQTTTLTRKPSGSSASVSSNAFTTDVTGYYTATVGVAALANTRTITVVCFAASVLTLKSRPSDPNSPLVNRSMLGALVLDQRVTLTTIAAALEGGATFSLPAICGGGFVGWSAFGG